MDKFSIVANGYNPYQVNQFVEEVITQTEVMIKKIEGQKKELDNLNHELSYYKNIEDTLKKAIYQAQVTSDNMKRLASDEANLIIDEARKNASRIVNEALIKTERLEMNQETLERNMRIFKKKLKSIIEQQLVVVEEIEILDLK
jgi:cell division initiation protein